MTERIVDDPSQHGWVDAGNGKWEWAAGGSSGGGSGGVDSGWALEGESTVYRSSNDNGVYIVDEREPFMFHRAQLYMVNQGEMDGGWFGAEYNALQLGVALGVDPENPASGVRSPIVTLHKDGMQCSIGSWQKPDTDEKLYVVGDGKFTGTVQATDYLDADGNSIVGGGDPDWAKVSVSGTAIGVGADVGSGGTSYGLGAYSESRGVALGWQAVATDEGAIAVGGQARVEYESAIAIGQNASCNGRYGIALGYQTQAEENQFTICDQIDEVQFGKAELRTNSVSAEYYRDADGNDVMQTLTQAEYDALTPNANTVYFIV